MPNIYGMLDVGRTALATQQKAIAVTGNNIANVNTPGYSRQRVHMEQSEPTRSDGGQLGRGVQASREVQRIYDQFLESQIVTENQNFGRWQTQKDGLAKVELLFDEASGYGINNALSMFWGSWQDLSNNPTGHVERTTLVANSEIMAGTFNRMAADLEQLQAETDYAVQRLVDEINPISEQIAELNWKIASIEGAGNTANQYRDERDLLLKDLSEKIDINYFEDGDGFVHVMVGEGRPLVDNVNAWQLETRTNVTTGLHDLYWVDSAGTAQDITGEIDGGNLKGHLEVRDTYIPDFRGRLDTLAGEIISQVNTLHTAGYGIDGVSTGNDFFSGTDARTIAVHTDIQNDNGLIAAAQAVNAPGDARNAAAIAALQDAATIGSSSFQGYYASLVSDAGSYAQESNIYYDYQSSMLRQMESYREEVSGVSLDEEMVNLVKYQNAYNAAAKMVSTVDELLETLIAMT
ncbi:MAG: flagellar hook-associated protein FlgK [Desulfosarcinaceae bacterium]|nr:flagellar hook-associated protein FlgK [Desulfosarcinaceae bacterium]